MGPIVAPTGQRWASSIPTQRSGGRIGGERRRTISDQTGDTDDSVAYYVDYTSSGHSKLIESIAFLMFTVRMGEQSLTVRRRLRCWLIFGA